MCALDTIIVNGITISTFYSPANGVRIHISHFDILKSSLLIIKQVATLLSILSFLCVLNINAEEKNCKNKVQTKEHMIMCRG